MLYFAYGANLNLRGMKRRCPRATTVGVATLKGYRLEFRRFATLTADPAAEVAGALYDLTPACWRALELYEGEDYVKQDVTVETPEGPRAVVAYVMQGGARAAPALSYFTEIARGYADWKLDDGPLRRARLAVLHESKPEKSRKLK